MEHKTSTIVFEQLQGATAELAPGGSPLQQEASPEEIEEIAELRRVVLEITEPEPMSYTSA